MVEVAQTDSIEVPEILRGAIVSVTPLEERNDTQFYLSLDPEKFKGKTALELRPTYDAVESYLKAQGLTAESNIKDENRDMVQKSSGFSGGALLGMPPVEPQATKSDSAPQPPSEDKLSFFRGPHIVMRVPNDMRDAFVTAISQLSGIAKEEMEPVTEIKDAVSMRQRREAEKLAAANQVNAR